MYNYLFNLHFDVNIIIFFSVLYILQLEFFEVSSYSFINKLGVKAKEGLVEKCSGGRRINIQCCGCLSNLHLAGTWNKRFCLC